MRYERRQDPDCTTLWLRGRLNEHTDLEPVLAEVRAVSHPVVLDLNGIQSTNSIGVSRWLRFMHTLGQRPGLALRACSPAIVSQLRMVKGFSGCARLESFIVTYACDDCGRERPVLWTAGQEFEPGGWVSTAEVKCDRCKTPSPMVLVDPHFELAALVKNLQPGP